MTALPEQDDAPRYELNGDQYELFPLPKGPSRMFRALLGQPELLPVSVDEPQQQYEIFPELGAALQPKPEPPPGMVDDSTLGKLQEVLNPSVVALGAILEEPAPVVEEPARQVPRFDDDD